VLGFVPVVEGVVVDVTVDGALVVVCPVVVCVPASAAVVERVVEGVVVLGEVDVVVFVPVVLVPVVDAELGPVFVDRVGDPRFVVGVVLAVVSGRVAGVSAGGSNCSGVCVLLPVVTPSKMILSVSGIFVPPGLSGTTLVGV
jgi:hypothetical protein